MIRMLDLERNVQGLSEELELLTAQLFEKVVPWIIEATDRLETHQTSVDTR